MSSRPVFVLWVSINVKKVKSPSKDMKSGGGIHFAIPLPAFLLLMLTDIAEDFSELIALFVPRNTKAEWASFMQSGVLVLKIVTFEILFKTGPTDLVDVDVKESNAEHVKVKILLR